jgi:integrase
MVALNKVDGRWFARKVIPKDVREDYQRLFGVRREAHFKLPADTPKHEAKARHGEFVAEIETRIATLRARRNGEGQPLTRINAIALAGRWYLWFLKQYEDDPGTAKRWRQTFDYFVDVIRDAEPDDHREQREQYPHHPHDDWEKEPEVREAVRPHAAEIASVARFLASAGMALNASAYALFVDAVSDNLLSALSVLERRANGDYSRDDTPDSFPPFTDGPVRSAGVSCWELFEAYVAATKPAPNTVGRWRCVFEEMQREFAEVGADGITEDDARTWIHGRITGARGARTVRDTWLKASRRVFRWALSHKRIRQNPFKEVTVDVPRKVQTREDGRSFTAAEATTILRASLAYEKPTTPTQRARRWVPWLCAYSGARAGEITQLRGCDVEDRNGLYVMKLTPDAGTQKKGEIRVVPLHEHIVVQGFMEMVRQVGKGALFFNDRTSQQVSDDPLKPTRSRAATARAQLGAWVRGLGVNDPGISPNHGWRHLFKRIADESGIPEKVHDAITGHAQATEGRKYGPPSAAAMADALKKLPRYSLD